MSNKSKLRQEFNAHIRDEYIKQHPYCEYCGEPVKADHVHHIIPLISGGDNRPSNLISLCAECHGKIHGRNLDYVELQRQGIEKAKAEGKYHGRKEIQVENFPEHYEQYKIGAKTKVQLAKELNISRPTLDKLIKQYEDEEQNKRDD